MTESMFADHTADFKLSITRALADQLAEALDALRPTPLDLEALDALQDRPGVYELWLNDQRVYVGKASKSLPARLKKHLRKLSGRSGMTGNDVGFMCLYVDEDLDAAGPEKMLIKKYRLYGEIPWNTNGFGNNDPGRNRDNSLVKANHFDAHYPIDLSLKLADISAGKQSVRAFLRAAKRSLPFNLRFESRGPAAKELAQFNILATDTRLDARDVITQALEALPAGWQASALPGYLILYKEERIYGSASSFWRKDDAGAVVEIKGPGELDAPEEIDEDPNDDKDEAED